MTSSPTPSSDTAAATSPQVWGGEEAQRARLSELVRTTQSLRGWTSIARLKLAALVLAIGIAASTVLMILHQRDEALATARREVESLAYVLSHQADRTLQAVELVQRAILDRLGDVSTPQEYRAALTGRPMHEDLRNRITGLPQVEAVTTIDRDGNLINFSRYWPIPAVNIADRDYYKALQANPALGIFISAPVRNRGTGTWTAYVARSVVSRDGEFLGLILVGLDLSYFEALYRDAGFGQQLSASLFRDDGVLLVRHPQVEPSAVPVPRLHDAIQRARSTGATRGVLYERPEADGQESRLVAVVPLSRQPLAVAVSVARADALAAWRRQALMLGGAGLLLEIAVIGIGTLVARQLTGQARLAEANLARGHAEAELAQAWANAEAERAARIRDARYVLALNSMSQGLCMFDAGGRLSLMNQRFEAMFDAPPGSMRLGMAYAEVVARILGGAGPEAEAAAAGLLARTRTALATGDMVSVVHDHPDGRAWSISMVPEGNGGWLATFEDVTERRQAEAKAAYLARHDALTGLANRTLFRERLEQTLLRSRAGECFALLCLDLDRFKWVNDTLGHPVGDALLRAVTERLRGHCRPVDTIARLGGDEFAVIQDGISDPAHAVLLAERLIDAVSRPYQLDGHEVRIGTSIGIALIPQDGDDPMTLLKRADLALYAAKRQRGTWSVFEPSLELAAQARPAMERELRAALREERFEVHYQPIVDLHTLALTGFEALVRWRHPERGLIRPDEFIPLAEEIGLIRQLDAWVLRRACTDALSWPAEIQLSANLSPRHFREDGPVAMVRKVLQETGLPAGRLELELTESSQLDPDSVVQGMMRGLKGLGVRLAVDDLGAGYSRLEYLRKFPLDNVKIDKSIVDDVATGEKSRAIIDGLGALCSRLGLSTTVEGVETEEQLRELQQSPCTNAQGYLFGRPAPAAEALARCREAVRTGRIGARILLAAE